MLKRLKDENDLEDIPVIAVTVLADDWDEDEYLSYGFDAYLDKSIANSIFLNTVAGFSIRVPLKSTSAPDPGLQSRALPDPA